MGEKEEKINKLADSLHKGGFSTSESGALEKAREMVETEEKIKESQRKRGFFGKIKEKFVHKEEEPVNLDDYDLTKDDRTVNELMKEAGVDVEELSKAREEKKKPEKTEEIEKKEEIKEDPETLEEEEGESINID